MERLVQDLRYALRALRKSPLFTTVVVLTLALGIGANTTIYTWLEGLVLHPLPVVHDADRLVLVKTRGPGGAEWSFSYPDARDIDRDARAIEGLVAQDMAQVSVRTGAANEQAERGWAVEVTSNYFSVLGLHPVLGRFFRASEDSAPGANPVVVLAYGYWQRRFAGDSSIIGRTISLNNHPFTVIGIAPPRFGGIIVALNFDLWVPASMDGAITGRDERLTSRGWRSFDAFARLKPGVTFQQAQAEIGAIGARLAGAYHEDEGTQKYIAPFDAAEVQKLFRPAVLALLGITAVVLLIACANVGNLLLARAAGRRREMGIRLALGARRAQLVRQLLAESLVLAICGGALGVGVAAWGADGLIALVPASPFPIALDFHQNARILLFAFVVTLGTVLLFGVVPALQASNPSVVPALKNEQGATGARGRLRSTFVVAQLSLSLVALVCAGLFMRSLRASESVDAGFRAPDHVLLVSTDLHLAGYDPSTGRVFDRQLLERVEAIPGVTSASLSGNVPLGFGGHNSSGTTVEGYTPGKDEDMSIDNDDVGPRYFETIGTALVAGRDVTATDDSGAMRVVIVNEAFAKRYWPRQDPLGKWIAFGSGIKRTVVGVAATAKYHKLAEAPLPFVFLPLAQSYGSGFTLHVRTAGDPTALTGALRRTFASLDPNVPFLDVRTFREHMAAAVFFQRLGAIMLGLFGALALALATMGIYSVIAYSVSQRTRELGIRTALGAARNDLLSLVLGEGMRLAAIGVGIGTVLALGAAQLVRSQLFGVSATDPVTFLAIGALLAAVALLATYLPARRAASIDPMVALRSE